MSLGLENWKDVIPSRSSVRIENLRVFEKYIVFCEREQGIKKIKILSLQDTGSGEHYLELPEPIYAISIDEQQQYNGDILRFNYSSMATPHSVYDYDMCKKSRILLKQMEVFTASFVFFHMQYYLTS